jgi:hypothetical protein
MLCVIVKLINSVIIEICKFVDSLWSKTRHHPEIEILKLEPTTEQQKEEGTQKHGRQQFIYEVFPSKESQLRPKTVVVLAYKPFEISEGKSLLRAEF